MGEKSLSGFFEEYLEQESIFINKKALQHNFLPETIEHRDEQLHLVAKTLAPVLKGDKPSNLFIYGKTGTGKTLTVKVVTNQLLATATSKDIPLKVIYLNCKLRKVADTEYRLIAQLAREFGKEIPTTGLPTDEVYSIFYKAVDSVNQNIVIVLDEIDSLVGKIGDEILYNLTRINGELKQSQITIVGISNDLVFTETLDARVKSSLSEEELVYPPYNADQLRKILQLRVSKAFKEEAIENGVIEKCAALSAREHGDARRAIELLRVSGELAERDQAEKVELRHLDIAENKIEKDRVLDTIKAQPKQYHAILYSILKLYRPASSIMTGEVYETYKMLCEQTQLRPLTQRRVSDVISDLDGLGIITAKVTSKGRYGRTREITAGTCSGLHNPILTILENELELRHE